MSEAPERISMYRWQEDAIEYMDLLRSDEIPNPGAEYIEYVRADSVPAAQQPDSDLRQLLVDISIICGPSAYELHRSLAKRAERYLWSTASTSQPGADLRERVAAEIHAIVGEK